MNVSVQTKNKLVAMPPSTKTPTKTRVQLWQADAVVAENVVALGAKQNYPTAGAGNYTVKTQNMAADDTPVGPEVEQQVQFLDEVQVPVADGVDVVYEPA
jgi:hypothetical protein